MTATRPFRVLGVQQVAIGSTDKQKLRRLWVDLLGVEPVGDFRSDDENVDELILRAGEGEHAVEIDLMQPLRPGERPR
ncbi:MAG TPA: VOC family protein, partial [Polyangiaceae bacterium]|nr:VOC family protein [Polyangiaceae bacterium]